MSKKNNYLVWFWKSWSEVILISEKIREINFLLGGGGWVRSPLYLLNIGKELCVLQEHLVSIMHVVYDHAIWSTHIQTLIINALLFFSRRMPWYIWRTNKCVTTKVVLERVVDRLMRWCLQNGKQNGTL